MNQFLFFHRNPLLNLIFYRMMYNLSCLCLLILSGILAINGILAESECSIVINELNTDEPHIGSQEFSEFIELKKVCSTTAMLSGSVPVRLRDFLLIGVQEYSGDFRRPVVSFSADFYRSPGFKTGSSFFVIASKEKQEAADMFFTDTSIGYQGKTRHGLPSSAPSGSSQSSIIDFFKSASKTIPTEPNALKNGNGKSAMAIILLYQRDFSRSESEGSSSTTASSIGRLRLARMHATQRRPVYEDKIMVDDSLAEIIRNNVHDMIIYGRSTQNNRCTFFESIYRRLRDKPNYILKPAREWDELGHEDYSINRCPESGSELRKPLLFTRWKLGRLTPGRENDCSGAHWILEDNIEAIINTPSREAGTSADSALASASSATERIERRLAPAPAPCSESSHRSELARSNEFSEQIAANRDHAVRTAAATAEAEGCLGGDGDGETSNFCSAANVQERKELLENDQQTSELQAEIIRQVNIQRQSTKRSLCQSPIVDLDSSDSRGSGDAEIVQVNTAEAGPSQRKRPCISTSADACLATSASKPSSSSIMGENIEVVPKKDWEDTSGFREEWLHSLEMHQSQ